MPKNLLAALTLFMAATLAQGAETTSKSTLTIKGMTCGGCVAAVKRQLGKTEGVTAYDVSLEKGEAEVTYDPARTDPKKIAEWMSKAGFSATVKEGDEPRKESSIFCPGRPKGQLCKGGTANLLQLRGDRRTRWERLVQQHTEKVDAARVELLKEGASFLSADELKQVERWFESERSSKSLVNPVDAR